VNARGGEIVLERRKAAVFYAIIIALLLALSEALSFSYGRFIAPDIFSAEEAYFASISEARYERWLHSPWYDADLGWNTPTVLTSETRRNCIRQGVEYTLQDQHRGIPLPGMPAVALFGDSYTFGDEVDDDSTSAAALERLIGKPVVNYGARGFGPEQAVLKFERLAAERPMPRIAVLIIMHENIRRAVNSFRPVYYSATDMRYGLKPFIVGDAFQPAPRPTSYVEFLREARHSFANDFWERPSFSFPYSMSLLKAVATNSFYVRKIGSRGRPGYAYEYGTDNPQRTALTTAIKRWRSSTSALGIRSFVLFVPQSSRDAGVAAAYVDTLNTGAGEIFAFEFEDASIDWKRYNLKASGECHPSRYGQQRIASFIAGNILPEGP
jgi:hypothetical protein